METIDTPFHDKTFSFPMNKSPEMEKLLLDEDGHFLASLLRRQADKKVDGNVLHEFYDQLHHIYPKEELQRLLAGMRFSFSLMRLSNNKSKKVAILLPEDVQSTVTNFLESDDANFILDGDIVIWRMIFAHPDGVYHDAFFIDSLDRYAEHIGYEIGKDAVDGFYRGAFAMYLFYAKQFQEQV